MIAIVDSGATKADWVILDASYKEKFRTVTAGMNPYHVPSAVMLEEISKNADLVAVAKEITHVFFYGSGCSNSRMHTVVREGLMPFFTEAEHVIDHDLLAACYATYKGKPTMVCILGTGSNSCYFDGKTLREETRSLAYILGDEGGGCDLGKRLLQAYFLKKMPKHLGDAFHEEYNLSVDELNKNVYQNQFASAYIASFSTFIAKHKQDPFIQKIIYDAMKSFMENQIMPYPEARSSELNFIGSIAYYYEDIIRAAAAEYHFNVGHIVQKPIDNLVQYHIDYLLNKPQ